MGYGSGSGFLACYGYGSGSASQKDTVPFPDLVPQRCPIPPNLFSVPGGTVLHPEDLLPGAAARTERPEEQPAPHPASSREPPPRSSLAARLEHLSLESCDYVTEAGVKFILGTRGSAHICSMKSVVRMLGSGSNIFFSTDSFSISLINEWNNSNFSKKITQFSQSSRITIFVPAFLLWHWSNSLFAAMLLSYLDF
jgi:hypothetical protein